MMIKAIFIQRKNRFCASVEVAGEIKEAHVANSGRLKELLKPGKVVYLVEKNEPHRSTKYDLELVEHNNRLVSVDARIPNTVVSEAINDGQLIEFSGYTVARREIKYGDSRLDILLANSQMNKFYVEVKSATLVENNVARFPDAPTERGARHLEELLRAVKEGHRAAVVFLIQRDDAEAFSPNDMTDPKFGLILRKVVDAGVEAYAFKCEITLDEVKIIGSLPVRL